MPQTKSEIISQLKKDILPFQGFKQLPGSKIDVGLGPLNYAFPNGTFPLGAVHEFGCTGSEDTAATNGFIAAIMASLMRTGGVSLWISSCRTLFPPALKACGIDPDKIIFIDLKKKEDILWVMEEALKCNGLTAVAGEISEINFTASRRLQLAVEQSQVTGFIIRNNSRNSSTTACVTRWKITHLPSLVADGLPGVGFPRWNIELLKIRNGKPGTWQAEWAAGRFRFISTATSFTLGQQQKRTG